MAHNTTDTETDDRIGKRVFDTDRYHGLGVIVDRKTERNGLGDTREVYVCDNGDFTDGTRFVHRPVDKVEAGLECGQFDTYDIGEIFDDASRENYDLPTEAE